MGHFPRHLSKIPLHSVTELRAYPRASWPWGADRPRPAGDAETRDSDSMGSCANSSPPAPQPASEIPLPHGREGGGDAGSVEGSCSPPSGFYGKDSDSPGKSGGGQRRLSASCLEAWCLNEEERATGLSGGT